MNSTLRLAHVHLMRCGGTFTAQVLDAVLPPGCQRQNSWFHGYDRDWTTSELVSFLDQPGSMYVHNHVVNWTADLVRRFQAHGFLVFAFVRSPMDQLMSVYRWLRMREPDMHKVTLDEFIAGQLKGECCLGFDWNHWAIPDYWQQLDWVEKFSEEKLAGFLCRTLKLTDANQKQWAAFHRNGAPQTGNDEAHCLRQDTVRRLKDSVFQRRYETIVGDCAAIASANPEE